MAKIKKGDTVQFITGKDKGKSGKVIHISEKEGRLTVEGLHMFKKHVRPRREGEKGEVVSLARPVPISNVMIVCPSCHKPTRVGYRTNGETKARECKKCKAAL